MNRIFTDLFVLRLLCNLRLMDSLGFCLRQVPRLRILVGCLMWIHAWLPLSATITVQGTPLTYLAAPQSASQPLRDAVEDFHSLLSVINGDSLSLIFYENESRLPEGEFGVVVGVLPETLLLPPLALETASTFAITTDSGNLYLKGTTEMATSHALYYFLQHFGGARWFQPGDAYSLLPSRPEWELGSIRLIKQPSLVSVEFAGLNSEAEQLWARRNLIRPTIQFHHNLYNLFTPDLFSAHPHWKAHLDGGIATYGNGGLDPQPDLLQEGVVAHAAQSAETYFSNHPAQFSVSLGTNDSVHFDTRAHSQKAIKPLRFFRNRPILSDLVYTFMNRVAEQLPSMEPIRYLGCLAYFNSELPPRDPLHPQVIPYLTLDSGQWHDEAWKAEDQSLMSAWTQSGATHLGYYDYQDSNAHYIPSVTMSHKLAALWHVLALDYTGYFLELYPRWDYDGPLPWLIARISVDKHANVNTLLQEYYTHLYGNAAGLMQTIATTLESAWDQHSGDPAWLKYFRHPAQARLLTQETRAKVTALLREAEKQAQTPNQRRRIDRIRETWQTTVLACTYYEHYRNALLHATPPSAEAVETFQRIREQLKAVPEANTLRYLLACTPNATLDARGNPTPPSPNLLANPELQPDGTSTRLTYAAEALPNLRDWGVERMPDATSQLLWTESGKLALQGCSQLVIWQTVPVTAKNGYRLQLSAEGRLTPGARASATVQYFDEDFKRLPTPPQHLFFPDEALPEAGIYALDSEAPAAATQARILFRMQNQDTRHRFYLNSIQFFAK